jgi:hypothetical protein
MITRKEASKLVRRCSLSHSCKRVLENAVYATFTPVADDAERPVKTSVNRLFKDMELRDRRKRAILAELRDSKVMEYTRYADKITYQLTFQHLPMKTDPGHSESTSGSFMDLLQQLQANRPSVRYILTDDSEVER